uniref:NADH-ubiquinone oxidoreductase chain 3 n=1 Tax=Parapsyche difformis TaxID=2904886 RepID=A0A9E8RTP0_9NEOP|nr:NADH dehydrogenase subunit 3 [Parapsyche difformis]UZZ43681.1 NADH dehydrogenase subunit 3 [Parapsyche difformis]
MLLSISLMLIIMALSLLMILLSLIISKKKMNDREKISPFECGFDPKSLTRSPFSMQFFIITIIFLIFDVEISLLLPMILTFNTSNMIMWFSTTSSFIIILILGILYEWNQSLLNWKF